MIALAVPWIRKISVWQRALMTWAGLAGILLAAVLYNSSTPFPGDAALLPVLSAALVIAGGIRPGPARGAVGAAEAARVPAHRQHLLRPLPVALADPGDRGRGRRALALLRRQPAADRLCLRPQLRDVQDLRGPAPPRAGAACAADGAGAVAGEHRRGAGRHHPDRRVGGHSRDGEGQARCQPGDEGTQLATGAQIAAGRPQERHASSAGGADPQRPRPVGRQPRVATSTT